MAKREQWKKDKEEGIVHERKVSGPPQTPSKPEALAKREGLLGRSDSTKAPPSPEKSKIATPEALAKLKSLGGKPKPETSLPQVEKRFSAPGSNVPESASKPSETSKLAARFNPALAGILSRGPPAVTNGSNGLPREESPERTSTPRMTAASEPPVDAGQLQDMRKGRAKGPKKRKGATKEVEHDLPAISATDEHESGPTEIKSAPPADTITIQSEAVDSPASVQKPKPRALPGSAASIMAASLQQSPTPTQKPAEMVRPSTPLKGPRPLTPATTTPTPIEDSLMAPNLKPTVAKPVTPTKSPSILKVKEIEQRPAAKGLVSMPATSEPAAQSADVPDFKGFGSLKKQRSAIQSEDNKENSGESLPSVKSAALGWGQQSIPKKAEPPSQIQLPSRRDEEAAMRSAGLLASTPSRPGSSNGLGITVDKSNVAVETPPVSAGAPPRPLKSSRSVSGQLQEASPNKGQSTR